MKLNLQSYLREVFGEGEFPEDEKAKQCNCAGWVKSMNQIESAQMIAWNHGQLYRGDKFIYCPWCGTRLRESEEA